MFVPMFALSEDKKGYDVRLMIRAVSLFVWGSVFAMLFSVIGMAQGLPELGDPERDALSPIMERKLGEKIMQSIRRDPDYLDDAPVLEYLNHFGSILLSAYPQARGEAGYDFFFFSVRDPALNAFALPGGFVAVHSGLVLAAQTESELASVLAHEMGHVSQRHVARVLGKQKQDSLIPLASLLLAVVAARSSPDAAMAAVAGGQGITLQRQLNASRDAEREADRIGLQILREAEFDTSGMVAFFGKMQKTGSAYSSSIPAVLLTHPLTTERIADIQARIKDQRYKQRVDSLDFYLVQSRLRVVQDESVQGWREATLFFQEQLQQKIPRQWIAAKYGLAFIALKRGSWNQAHALLTEARRVAEKSHLGLSSAFASLSIDIQLAARQFSGAVEEAHTARMQFPESRGIAHQYVQTLIAAGRLTEAIVYLRDQIQLYHQDVDLYEALAKAYAASGKQALQHIALAESYALTGSVLEALDQLVIARRAPDASFYELAIIDAREREFQAVRREELEEERAGR